MKQIRLFLSADEALGETKTPVVFYLKGAPKPMFAPTEKWGESCTIVIDETEGSAGIKPESFTIIFMDNEGNVISSTEYKSGDTIIIPDAPVKSGLTFIGWGDVQIDKAVTNMTYFAQYEVTPKVTLNMSDSYTDMSSIALNAAKTETVTGNIEFTVSIPSDVYHLVDEVIIFDKHFEGNVTVTASATDVHGNVQSDSKVISVLCDVAYTVECVISDVTAADIKASDTTAIINYTCNVTTTHAGVSNTAISYKTKTVTVEANNTSDEVTREGSFECEHGETVNWSVKQAGRIAEINGHQCVDLGITGSDGNPVYFATCNVGANSPEGYGDYFMWGSTTPNNTDKCYMDDPNLPYHTGTSKSSGWTKYVQTGKESYGTVDNKKVLDPDDDAAHVIMGGNWRMPTMPELSRLFNKPNVWGTINRTYGRIWYAGTDTSKAVENMLLFIPAAGERYNGNFSGRGDYCCLWSSQLTYDTPYLASFMVSTSSMFDNTYTYERCYGFSVRGVASL